ncbi:MAG: YsnF/AvaK domain-containing protein [Ktedonobacteraceae bacterium]
MTAIDSAMIVGVFKDEAQAQQALTSLHSAGFEQTQLLRAGHGTQQAGGLLSGIKRLFAGANASGESEGIAGTLADTGISATDAHYYQQEYEAGRTILTIRAKNERQQEILDILHRYDASDAQMRNAQANATAAHPSSTIPNASEATGVATDAVLTPESEDLSETYDRRRIDLHEERLDITKQPVQTGEVQLHKEVVSEQRTVDVPVTHEEVVVTKHPVSSRTNDTTPIGQDDEIRVPVSEERVQVTKATVTTGEVSINTRTVQETQHVADTTKREELRVEQEGDAPIHGTPSDRFHYHGQQQARTDGSQGRPQPRARSRKKR